MRSFPFLFREALVNLRRHSLMTAAAVTTIGVALALLGGFLLLFYQVNTAAHRALDDFEMRVFCRLDVGEDEIPRLRARIEALPGVAGVRYVSREEAWQEQTRNYPIDTTGIPNQMNDTFVVKMADADKAASVAREIRGWHGAVQEVSLPESDMRTVLRIAGFVRNAGIAGAALLLLGALVVVSNTIRVSVFSRRREIKVMQLVGATPWFIRLPLLIEGLLHGLAGGSLAALCLLGAGHYAAGVVRESLPALVPYGGAVDWRRFALALVAGGALVGVLGSFVSIRRYLRSV